MIYTKRTKAPALNAALTLLRSGGGPEPATRREFLRMMNIYEGAMKKVGVMLENYDSEFRTLTDHNPIHHMESRIKTVESILDKLNRKGLEPTIESIQEHITDVVGLRIVCPYVKDIYYLTDLLCRQEDIEVIRKSDYIEHPKKNGYRSMHLVVRVPVSLSDGSEWVPVEIQLRTIAMDMWASLEHELHYKSKEEPVAHLSDRLRRCATSLADVDLRMQEIYDYIKGESDIEPE